MSNFFPLLLCRVQHLWRREDAIIHNWGDWEYREDHRCEQTRLCIRCKEQRSTRVVHNFADWQYLREGSCIQVRTCMRCKEPQQRVLHEFTVWQYADKATCTKVSYCLRCTEDRVMDDQHDFEYLTPEHRICKRCRADMSREICRTCGGTGTVSCQSDMARFCSYSPFDSSFASWCGSCPDFKQHECPICSGSGALTDWKPCSEENDGVRLA